MTVTAYDREFDFTSYQASAPSSPLPGSHVDAELNRVKASVDSLIASLGLIQRDDGQVANASIGLDQLSPTVTVGFNTATQWATAKAYTTADFVFNGALYYHCLVAHTSGTFATDLAAGKWLLLVDFSALSGATTSAAGIIQIATDVEALAKAATNKAIVASNLAALSATTSFEGMVQLASNAEAIAASANNRAITPSNLAALTAANLTALKASDAQAAAKSSTSVFVTPGNLAAVPIGTRNILRANGGMEVWQRGSGGTSNIAVAASTTAYTADRWYLATGANQASHVSPVAGIANGSQYAAQVIRDSGQTGTGTLSFGFPLDTDETYQCHGGILALSFTVKAGANWSPTNGTLNYNVYFSTATPTKRATTPYTGETNPITGSVNLTPGGAAQRITITASGAAATNTLSGEVQFSWAPAGTAGVADSIQIDDVQLEVVPSSNSVASVFERTAFEECLRLCQRHFWKSFPYAIAPAQNGGATGALFAAAGRAGALVNYVPFRFPVAMRSSPPATLTSYNPTATNAQVYDAGAAASCSSTGVSVPGDVGGVVLTTGNASTAVGNLLEVHVTADAGI